MTKNAMILKEIKYHVTALMSMYIAVVDMEMGLTVLEVDSFASPSGLYEKKRRIIFSHTRRKDFHLGYGCP
jgi:hypothetical protein